jgi:hypothetical protein
MGKINFDFIPAIRTGRAGAFIGIVTVKALFWESS